jgi:hypothetical protein
MSRTFYTHGNLLNRRHGDPQGQSGVTEEEENTFLLLVSPCISLVTWHSLRCSWSICMLFFAMALRPNAGHGLVILKVSRSHIATHHIREDSSGRVISSFQRPLPDNAQHSQQTNIHAPGRIRTHDLSRREAADLRLRSRDDWDRLHIHTYCKEFRYPGG